MTKIAPSNLLGIYLFGSEARGDSDALSDLDILAVVRNNSGKVPEDFIVEAVPAALLRGRDVSISWYGYKRLSKMFVDGDLFAWHLYREATPIFEARYVFDELGVPEPYLTPLLDIDSFISVLRQTGTQLDVAPGNVVYENGLVYVCVRNVAMSASWVLNDSPDFSRYSPYRLDDARLECPLSRAEYECSLACRMAGQRGGLPPEGIDPHRVAMTATALVDWAEAVRTKVESRLASGG